MCERKAVMDSLKKMDLIYDENDGFTVTEKGKQYLKSFQIDFEKVMKKRRSFSHKWLDWNERRYHLAGGLGNALLERLLELNWVQRLPKTRALKLWQ